jgi:hypothetical protein
MRNIAGYTAIKSRKKFHQDKKHIYTHSICRFTIKQRTTSKAGPAEKADAKNLGAITAVNQKGLPAKPEIKKAVTVCILIAQGIEIIITGLIHLGGFIDLCSAPNVTRVIITFKTR